MADLTIEQKLILRRVESAIAARVAMDGESLSSLVANGACATSCD